MGERGGNGPVAAISPVQQMLASGTGALITSLFGEKETKAGVVLCVLALALS